MLLDPLGQLGPLIRPRKPLVGENHDTVVGFPSDCASDALCGVAHGVEGQKVVFFDLELVAEVVQTRFEYSGLCVDVGDAEHEDCAA